jgi:uncharacterized Zn-finger protein
MSQTSTHPETICVPHARFACDGGNSPGLGHPRVFLTVGTEGDVDCPYCGRHYVCKTNAD